MLRKCVFPLLFVAGVVLAVLPLPMEGQLTSAMSPDQIGSQIDPNGARLSRVGRTGRILVPFGGWRSTPQKWGGRPRLLGFLGLASEGEIGSHIDPNGNKSAIRLEVDPNG